MSHYVLLLFVTLFIIVSISTLFRGSVNLNSRYYRIERVVKGDGNESEEVGDDKFILRRNEM